MVNGEYGSHMWFMLLRRLHVASSVVLCFWAAYHRSASGVDVDRGASEKCMCIDRVEAAAAPQLPSRRRPSWSDESGTSADRPYLGGTSADTDGRARCPAIARPADLSLLTSSGPGHPSHLAHLLFIQHYFVVRLHSILINTAALISLYWLYWLILFAEYCDALIMRFGWKILHELSSSCRFATLVMAGFTIFFEGTTSRLILINRFHFIAIKNHFL